MRTLQALGRLLSAGSSARATELRANRPVGPSGDKRGFDGFAHGTEVQACGLGFLVFVLSVCGPFWNTVEAEEPSRNQWHVISDKPESTRKGHARLLWLQGLKKGFIWKNDVPNDPGARTDAPFHLLDWSTKTWEARPSQFPEGSHIAPGLLFNSCVWLPDVKKVLCLIDQPSRWASLRYTSVCWLLDPGTGTWESIGDDLSMTHKQEDYNPSGGFVDSRVPLFGMLVYDGHNREAVLVGGGGTWGRVTPGEVPVKVFDWIYDESATPKHIRKLLPEDQGQIAKARRWFPAHCGTWTFSRGEWQPIAQSLEKQPSGRVLPSAAYDAGEKKIVLFGGDDDQRCLRDTWIYDCRTRTWTKVDPETSPPARAGQAMVYDSGQGVIVMAGGYGPGWKPLKDTWIFKTRDLRWSKLKTELPKTGLYGSAAYLPDEERILVTTSRESGQPALLALRLDLASVQLDKAPQDNPSPYHCKNITKWAGPVREDFESPQNKPDLTPEEGRQFLAALPANAWVKRDQPLKVRARQWGSYVYDVKTHSGFAWGGGHFGYSASEVSQYDLLTNRWYSMTPTFKRRWNHEGGSSPGPHFAGFGKMFHARKSYAVDPLSDTVITHRGDVYSIKHRTFVKNVGNCPGDWSMGSPQVTYVSTPHGLYAFHKGVRGTGTGELYQARVDDVGWTLVAKGGPPLHEEHNHMCYDAKRDRLVYFFAGTKYSQPSEGAAWIWIFDFKEKSWSEERVVGKRPPVVLGDSTYVPKLDSALMVFNAGDGERLWFYHLGRHRWYTSSYRGDPFPRDGNTSGRDVSPFYDPELGVVVRIGHHGAEREGPVHVYVMRLDPDTLKLADLTE
jgi:hypothetical protein